MPCVTWCYRYDVPLVADIHFQPVVASMVAECFEKIRVNPGNFVDGRKRFDEKVYDDDSQFKQEQEHIREVLGAAGHNFCYELFCHVECLQHSCVTVLRTSSQHLVLVKHALHCSALHYV